MLGSALPGTLADAKLLDMLDRERLRKEDLEEALQNRGVDPRRLATWKELDKERREDLVEVEDLKRRRNEASRDIGKVKKAGGNADEQIAVVSELKGRIAGFETRLAQIGTELRDIECSLPNLAHESVPVGDDESANREEKRVGEPRSFEFEPQAHWDLGPSLGILDFERGAKITGARFTAYFGAGARLERALISMMLDLHTVEHGYTEVLPPFIVNSDTLFGTGQLPKFADDLFHLEGTDYYLVPTAEVPVTNLHRAETLDEADLPVRYAAYSPCFRSEAGSHGRDVRGLIRQHQFNKVELVHLTTPATSHAQLEELTSHAERVLEILELPYRRVTLSTGDMGFSATKTFDLEVWLPGQQSYREISSCSNCTDFQARRAGLRYRPSGGGKPRWLHTLNGSGLAVGRTLIAILENYQEADGSVRVPEPLVSYLGGLRRIEAPG